MPWYSKAEAAQYQPSAAWDQLLVDPYNTKPNNSIQWGGSTACGLPIDRFCTINSPYEPFDEIAGRDMAFQAYNHSILWARTGDVASLNRIIEILEFWMIDPATRMLPILTTYSANGSNSIEQYVFVTAFFAAYNIIKDEPSFTSEPAIKQWITDFIASAWPYVGAANKEDWKVFCCIAGAAATSDVIFLQTIRDYFVVRLNDRFLADGRVKEDYLRTTGMSYTCFALEAINATCEIIFRNLGENLFTHPGLVLAHDYMIPYILAPSTWPWQQINTFQSVESRQYEFMYTRNAQAKYLPILDTGRPYYVDTATGHVTLTNSSAAVLNAPEIINIGIALQSGTSGIEAVISWDSNVPTTGDVSYGLTIAETETPITSTTLATSHSVILPNLALSSTYYFTVNIQNDLSVSASSTQSSFVAEVDTPPQIGTYSDEFNATTIDPQWTVVDPVGDGAVTANGAELVIFVPGAGVPHDAWSGGNESVRAMHPLPNEDFFMEISLKSIVEQRFQSQGFLVEVDSDNFIRFDFYSDDLQTFAHIGSIVDSVGTSISTIPVTTAQAQFLRVKRTGDLWEQWYSHNGVNWTLAGSFTRAINIVNAGVFAGNVGSTPIPSHTAQFNYYRIDQLPIAVTDQAVTVGTLGDYQTVQEAIDASDVTTGWFKIELIDDKAYAGNINISPATGTPGIGNYVWITSTPSARGDGTKGSGARIVGTVAGQNTINVNSSFVFIENIGIEQNSTGDSDEAIRINADSFNVLISRCIISSAGLAGSQDGVYAGAWDMSVSIDDCLIDGFSRAGIHAQGWSSAIDINQTFKLDHLDVINSGQAGQAIGGGISAQTNTAASIILINVNNCAILDTVNGDDYAEYTNTGAIVWSGQNNASSDNSLTARGLTNGAQESLVLTDVTQASGQFFVVKSLATSAEDYRLLDDSAGNLAYANGISRIGSEPDYRQDFSTDIVGAVRSQSTPSIGFSEYNPNPVQNPNILNVFVSTQDAGDNAAATISWETDINTTGSVAYGLTTAELEAPVLSPTLKLIHSVTLPFLDFGQQYYFTITATSADSGVLVTSQDTFIAASDEPPQLGGDIVYFSAVITTAPKYQGHIEINDGDAS